MTDSRKKGCRRKGCVIPAASISLIVAIFVGREAYFALTAVPGSAIDYSAQAAELVEKYQPVPKADGETASDENGWDALLDAIEAYDVAATADTSDFGWNDAFKIALDPLSFDPERTVYSLDQYLDTAESALVALDEQAVYGHLDRLAGAARYERPLPSGGRLYYLTITELIRARPLARAVTLQLRRANERHDDAAEVRAVVRGLALAKALSHQFTLVDRIAAMEIIDVVFEDLRGALTDRPLPEQELDQIADALDRSRFPSLRLAIEGLRLQMLDIIEWTHTDDGRGNGRLIVSRLDINVLLGGASTSTGLSSAIDNLASIRYPSKKQTTEQTNDLFDGFLEYIDLTRQERISQPSSPELEVMALPSRQLVLRQLVPNLDRFIRTNDRYDSILAGTRIMVAIERFNARNGRYPQSLDELLPDTLSSLPIDPFSKDGRFIYQKIDPEADVFGRPYTLYSVGYDQADNGGAIDHEQSIDAFDPKASGIDYVFNQPRQASDAGDN